MKRRTFLKMGLAAVTAANLPLLTAPDAKAALTGDDLSPRRVELLDADWRFLEQEPTLFATPVDDWVWTPGTPDQAAMMVAPNLDTSGSAWKKTSPGVGTLPENGYGWYRTVLPDIKGPGRTIHFESLDDNGTVYLNGVELMTHAGWDSSFDVGLDRAWKPGGPNVLTVLVQNLGGGGGIMQAVSLGLVNPHLDALSATFDDGKWRKVHLPHDYVVEGAYDPHGDVGHGALPVNLAWYRRRFTLPASDRGKSVWLHFEGVYRNATVHLNGRQIHFQDDGYDPFLIDIADTAHYGAENVLVVHVDARQREGWWYEGGGIYRHVWLNVADPVHVAPWGVHVTSDVRNVQSKPSATLTIQTDIANAGPNDRPVTVVTTIRDPHGVAVAHALSHQTVARAGTRVTQNVELPSAALWSLEKRNLYYAETEISADGRVIDGFKQRFGIRTLRFDPDHGFFLNEKPVVLQGTCNHQDFVGVGIAMTDSILHWRMKTLQEKLGCNAIRCSHNAMTPAMYEACDELGLLVMDETRHPGDAPVAKTGPDAPYGHTEHIETMIRRDRNHPSVIMWSMANEESDLQGSAFGAQMLTALMAAVRKHDTTRPVTTAVNYTADEGWMTGFATVETIVGVNYYPERYDWLHSRYPAKMIYGSEIGSNTSCRGIYQSDNAAGHLSSYMSPEGVWQPVASREFMGGGFVWTGFDYRGEPNPYPWPEIGSNFGLLDMCGFPKDAAFYYKAWWRQDEPLIHLFPHWNRAGQEGKEMPVWCFSNCDSVELFVNGVSQGVKAMPKFGHVQWDHVVYQPGTIKGVGTINGSPAATIVIETTGAPAALRLDADRGKLTADGEDTVPVGVSILDAQGRVVPTADNPVTFSVTGAGVNAGVGNGDPASHEPNRGAARSAFNGLCMMLIRSNGKAGEITLTAASPGLTGARLDFTAGDLRKKML